MFEYVVYGLAISSDVALPQLNPLESPENLEGCPCVRLRLKPPQYQRIHAAEWFHSYAAPDGRPALRQAKVAGGYLLSFPDLADFFVAQNGLEVTCCWPYAHGSIETICHLALDQVIPCVANLLGLLALHATAVLTPHGVCGFMGSSGVGKSTLAASFDLAGYPAFCDDCLVVVERGREMLAEPGYASVRLWEDSARSLLGESAADHPALGHYTNKRGVEGAAAADTLTIPRRRTPLVAIYHLTREVPDKADGESGAASKHQAPQREAPSIAELSAREVFAQLLRTTYRLDTTDQAMLRREFKALHSLVDRIPVRRLHLPSDFDALPAVREIVLNDLARIGR
ncbi:MAG TPA: hypothetical protein VIX59_19565 [Candidatus Binataceae bacterium]